MFYNGRWRCYKQQAEKFFQIRDEMLEAEHDSWTQIPTYRDTDEEYKEFYERLNNERHSQRLRI